VAEIPIGARQGLNPGTWEALWWEHHDDVIRIIEKAGFSLVARRDFDTPWRGVHVRLVS
jgi:hypothetical protein